MARPVKFLHAADFHLGAGFIGAQVRDQKLGLRLRAAVFEAFDAVIQTALDENIDFAVFAGDLFDVTESNYRAQGHFVEGLRRLEDQGIDVYMVAGNHDPLDGSDRLALPNNAHLFDSNNVGVMHFEKEGVQPCSLYGRSYPQAEVNSNYAQAFKRDTCVNAIGILHTNVSTESDLERYARCDMHDLIDAQMDYWALGHIHLTKVLRESNPCVIYPGSPQALNINETGIHGCYIVELDNGTPTYEWHPAGRVTMHRVAVDISSAANEADIRDCVVTTLNTALPDDSNEHLVRIILTGVSHLDNALSQEALETLYNSLCPALSGPFPNVYLDSTIINETLDSVEDDMEHTTNDFLRDFLDIELNMVEPSVMESAFQSKQLKTFRQEFPAEFEKINLSLNQENILNEAKELLYRRLMKRGY